MPRKYGDSDYTNDEYRGTNDYFLNGNIVIWLLVLLFIVASVVGVFLFTNRNNELNINKNIDINKTTNVTVTQPTATNSANFNK